MRFMCKHVAAVSQIIKYSTVRVLVYMYSWSGVKMTSKFLHGVSYRIFLRSAVYEFIKIAMKKKTLVILSSY